MKKIIRIIASFLILTMLSSTLVSCGNAKSSGSGSSGISGLEVESEDSSKIISESDSRIESSISSFASSDSTDKISSSNNSSLKADSSNPSDTDKLSPIEIIREINDATPILQTTASGCSLAVIPNVNDKNAVTRMFTSNGFSPVQVNSIDGAKLETLVFSRDETIVTMYWNKAKSELRIMWEYESYLKYFKPNSSTSKGLIEIAQIAAARLTEVDNPGTGMCYIIKLSNGHGVIIDSGEHNQNCADNIYSSLERLDIAKKDDKFLIDAWIFTHGHYDHIGAFLKFTPEYKDYVSVDAFVLAIPNSDSVSVIEGKPDIIYDVKTNYPSATIINPHAGLKYYFGNLTVSMLYTPDMYYASDKKITFYNDTSLVFKVEGGNSSMVFFGDAGEEAAKTMLSSYAPSTFKADAMQITHHGLTVVPDFKSDSENIRKVYEHINAKYALLPMGTRCLTETRNGRYTVLVDWCNSNYQSAFFMNKTDNHGVKLTQAYWDNFAISVENGTNTHATLYGYDGKNIIKNGRGLTTYIAASETDYMVTILSFSDGKVTVKTNELLYSWLLQ